MLQQPWRSLRDARMEHVISAQTFDALKKHAEHKENRE